MHARRIVAPAPALDVGRAAAVTRSKRSFPELARQLRESAPGIMAMKAMGFMFVWYGLLWSVIDACTRERTLDLRGPFREDMTRMEPTLRPGRNAILHVPRANDLLDNGWQS